MSRGDRDLVDAVVEEYSLDDLPAGGTVHSDEAVPAPTRRRWLILTGAGVVALGALMAGPATAAELVSFIDRAPQNAQEVERMEVFYQGRSYTWAQIYKLQKQGKAGYTVHEPVTYNKGQAHAFDSAAGADAWACANIAGLAARPVCRSQPPG
ncbi:hypothetical protein Kisp01_37680 [Kineosporia sp. NBRC 101677]|uniref:hypothetical protein n=1 Tax=Kineosporia sp. NBRC 101677 TaxID=3032197 RepID=UPI0024A01B4C|nr:hypothetical protein [Kineosporia sp. NBRC 101677]GLY16753.1 hypothetical protein Kisp01_37680 [Kineosporia sp. NBRC 101677]